MENESIIKSPIFWTRCTELFFSFICYFLTVEYPITEAAMFDHGVIPITNKTLNPWQLPNFSTYVSFTEAGFVRLHFLAIAVVAYTWIILPAMLISYFVHGRQYMDKNVMSIILNAVGVLMYLVGGSLVCSNFTKTYHQGANATGAMCVITSFIFLGEVCFVVYCNLKASRTTLPS